MKRFSLEELKAMPTLHEGHAANLKYESDDIRVWLHRTGLEDGEPFAHTATIEILTDPYGWAELEVYDAENP